MDTRDLKARGAAQPIAAGRAGAGAAVNYATPGHYVEEVAQVGAITPLSTDTTLFVGRTSRTPASGAERFDHVRSHADFTWSFGRAAPGDAAAAALEDAVHAYFASGGAMLRIAPVPTPDRAGLIAALAAAADLDDVATVAAPGAWLLAGADPLAVAQALLAHVALPGSRRFAIVDPPAQCDLSSLLAWRAQLESGDGALYHPWVVAPDRNGVQTAQPPSGFLAGIYAAGARAHGVGKAPGNEVVPTATGLTATLTSAHQDVLNPQGINCIVALAGRGIRLWGARTLSSDPERKYVNVRRLIRWVAASAEAGLRWATFAPNGPETWLRATRAVDAFLLGLWRDGALMGAKPNQAYFVRCDRATMTQADIDAGRLICEIGLAPVRPAEFIVVRIAMSTGDSPPR